MRFKSTIPADDEGVPMASMADIVFLLVTFFMVTSVFNVGRGVKIELPETQSAESISMKDVLVRIDAEGNVYLDGKRSLLKEVGPYVLSKRAENPRRAVIVESDRTAKYQYVMDVLDELLLVGVTDISLPTREEGTESPG
ncbi:biopolymer transporter ExbD [Candidatus Poribacteria bacterium]|nr:biopolymer transporter ExbD [Candidatus Poribacteria bacterium]